MKELVGKCYGCGKEVFCLDGFLNGVHNDGKILCFECEKEDLDEQEQKAQAPWSAPTSAGGPTDEVVPLTSLGGLKRLEGLGAGAGLENCYSYPQLNNL